MYWTLELASYLEDAPWPATKDELIDFAMRTGAPLEVVENLQGIEDDEEIFETIEDIWPDYPSKEDFFFNEDAAGYLLNAPPYLCNLELIPELLGQPTHWSDHLSNNTARSTSIFDPTAP